jgi:hypothetical protein
MYKSSAWGRIGVNALKTLKTPESIVEDFDSIRRYLNRLENERARSLSAPAVVIEECKSADRTNISHLWIGGKV